MADSWTKRSDGSTVWSDRARNTFETVTWTEATRPSNPFDGQTGFNTDFNGLETYSSTLGKWRIINGTWTVATRPTTTDIAAGSQGYNSDSFYGTEVWGGTQWQLI